MPESIHRHFCAFLVECKKSDTTDRLGCKPNKPTGRLKRWVYQPNLRRCKMVFRVTFSCISL